MDGWMLPGTKHFSDSWFTFSSFVTVNDYKFFLILVVTVR